MIFESRGDWIPGSGCEADPLDRVAEAGWGPRSRINNVKKLYEVKNIWKGETLTVAFFKKN